MDERMVTIRECDLRYNGIKATIMTLQERISRMEETIEKVETKFWWIITLLVGNLVGILVILIKNNLGG